MDSSSEPAPDALPGVESPSSSAAGQPGSEAQAPGELPTAAEPAAAAEPRAAADAPAGMITPRAHRSAPESLLMRLIATAGIVGIGTAIAAIMIAEHAKGWLTGLVVASVSVILAAVLWSSRRL